MINTLVEMFSYTFLIRAFVVGLLVSLCASMLGVSLVLKRYSMIGDGLSHVGFGSLAVATAFNWAPLAVSIPMVLAAAFILLSLSESSKIKGDAAIAMISTGALALGVVIISQTTGMNTDVCNYLFGSILAMNKLDVQVSVVLAIIVIVLFVFFYNIIFAITFDETFVRSRGINTRIYNMLIAFLTAITIVLGMRMMGAMLISSLIIFPSLTSMRIFKKFKSVTICSAAVSLLCYFFGLIISYLRAMPTGASVVILNIFAFLIFWIISIVKQQIRITKMKKNNSSVAQNMNKKIAGALLILLPVLLLGSCKGSLGWGVMLWAAEDAGIPSGTVVKVHIKSNINKVWVVGVPKEYRSIANASKIEVPISQLEFCGSKAAAEKTAKDFSEYALVYAETLQDGLPIRDGADNSARRIYRLRVGEIIKVLSHTEGTPAISATGDPLPGEWFRVLTEDGTQGYCFSYRLRTFQHTIGEIVAQQPQTVKDEAVRDADIDAVLSTTWLAEIYGDMINNNKIDIDAFSKHWGFSIGEDTGIANIYLSDVDKSFKYTKIVPDGTKSWRFEGTTLHMRLRSPTTLSVSYIDDNALSAQGISGADRNYIFINTPTSLDDIVVQEEIRRQEEYQKIFDEGPIYQSEFYGKLSLTENNEMLWEDFDILIPAVLPVSILGRGTIEIKYFLSDALAMAYNGVITMNLKSIGGSDQELNFLYAIDSGSGLGGLSLEYVPTWCIEDQTVVVRDTSPTTMYFYQTE
ncbi:MAG: hypothetical protein Ta2B_15510 [Termitinemataceae bacterium]|nr:MAG: hypothetical protein Ta2B_15510 [Termitinemataceae bacterium]